VREQPKCVVSVSLPDLDLLTEGTVARVTDELTLARRAERWAAALAPEVLAPVTAFGIATAKPSRAGASPEGLGTRRGSRSEQVEATIRSEGVFRVAKVAVCFVADL